MGRLDPSLVYPILMQDWQVKEMIGIKNWNTPLRRENAKLARLAINGVHLR